MNENWNKVKTILRGHPLPTELRSGNEEFPSVKHSRHTFKLGQKHTIAWKDVESITCDNIAAPIVVKLRSGSERVFTRESYRAEHGDVGCTQMLANTLSEGLESYLEEQAA